MQCRAIAARNSLAVIAAVNGLDTKLKTKFTSIDHSRADRSKAGTLLVDEVFE